MRRGSSSGGFVLCFFVNLLWRSWWTALALILWAVHLWLGIPAYISLIALGHWVLSALAVTVLVSWGAKSSTAPVAPRENKNPYSAKNSDLFPEGTP
jgi:hypothetical protein